MAAISPTTFSNGFPWMKMYEFWLKGLDKSQDLATKYHFNQIFLQYSQKSEDCDH